MVHILSAAKHAVSAYSAAIALGGNYSIPLPELASQVSAFFLPNYTSYTLGEANTSANQSVVAQNFISLYTLWRVSGPGTVVQVKHSAVKVVSDEAAMCWLTYEICPQIQDLEPWNWTNVYGFRLVDGGLENGLKGGWEFGIGDNEHLEYQKRFGSK